MYKDDDPKAVAPRIAEKPESPVVTGERLLTLPECTSVIITNSAASGTMVSFKIDLLDSNLVLEKTILSDQDLFFNANLSLINQPSLKILRIRGVNLYAHPTTSLQPVAIPEEMPITEVGYTGRLLTSVHFHGTLGDGYVYFQAVPVPGAGTCAAAPLAGAAGATSDLSDLFLAVPRR
jgi:hypothetical protein